MTPIRIVPPKPREDGKGALGTPTKVYSEGHEVHGVTGLDIAISPDSIITATVTMHAQLEEVWALPFMSEESFLAAAERYGYEVKKR